MSASALAGVEVLTMGSIQDKAPCCGRPSRTGRAFTCLPNWVFGQTTANEKAVLLTLQFHAPNIHPSLGTLAKESGLSQRTVQRVLVELEGKGWIAKEETTTASGGRGTNRYQLLIWQEAETEVEAEPDAMPPWSQWLGGIGQADQGAMDTVANKQEQSSNKRNPTALEPPLPPAAQGELRPLAVAAHPCRDRGLVGEPPEPQPGRDRDGFPIHPSQPLEQPDRPLQPQPTAIQPELLQAAQPQPQQPNAPRPLPEPPDPDAEAPVNPKGQRRRAAGFQPIEGDVPAALLPIARELLAFWACKGGKRTERAWVAQLGQLERIQGDPAGGTEAVRTQLEAGSQAAVFGKPWMAVTHANWERFGKRATPIIGTGFSGKRTTMDRVMGAIALVEERERKAAAQPVGRSELMLAEVA